MIDDKTLISKLMGSSQIDQEILRKGLDLAEKRGNTLYETLIFSESIDEFIVVSAASQILNVPCIHLAKTALDVQTAQMISREMATSTQSVPVEVIDDGGVEVLKLAMSDPIDVMAMDEVASHTGIDIQPVLAGPADIETAIEKLYDLDDDQDVLELNDVVDEPAIELEEEVVELKEIADDDIVAPQTEADDEESYELEHGTVDFDDEIELDDGFDFSADDDEEVNFDDELTPGSDEALIEDAVEDEFELANDGEGLAKDEDSWALMFDEAEEAVPAQSAASGLEAFSKPPSAPQPEASKTQIGSPAQVSRWSEEELLVESEADDEEESEADDKMETEGEESGLEEISWELEEIDDGGIEKEEAPTQSASSAEVQQEERQEDKKRVVPSSIRDMLKAKKSNKKADKSGNSEAKDPKGLRLPRPNKKAQKEVEKKAASAEAVPAKEESDGGGSTLGRIAVKKVAVPSSSFKGAIEKRSDRDQTSPNKVPTSKTKTANGSTSPTGSRTREMSLGEIADLTSKQRTDQSGVEIPDDVDCERLLRGLISLLVEQELVSAEDIQALMDHME